VDFFCQCRQPVQQFDHQFNQPDHKIVASASDVPNTYELRRPCGIMQLDIDTGGGLPAGGACCLSGPEGSGKTELLLNYFAMHQKIYGDDSYIAFAQVEGQFDFRLALKRGLKIRVPPRLIEQWRHERALRKLGDFTKEELAGFNEQVGEFVLIGGSTGEETMEAVLEAHKKNIFGIIGVDSINALMPEANAAKDLNEDEKRASRATLMTRFFHHYIPETRGFDTPNETTIIFVQQVRSNPDKATAPSYMQAYLKDWAVTGAYATRHFKLVDVIVWSGQKIKKQISGEKLVVGKEIKWEIDKGKAGCHDSVTGSTPFYYVEGLDSVGSAIIAGIRLGVITEGPKGAQVIRPETQKPNDDLQAPDVKTLEKMMRADFEFELAVRREILAGAGINCLYQ